MRRRRTLLEALILLAAVAVLRAPSLVEPAWAADEGAYANIGRALDLGGVLYRTVWDNKPPGVYWLSAAVTAGGASVLRVHLALLVLVAAGTLGVLGLGRRLGTPTTGLAAALAFAVLASVPNFDGNQLNAEMGGAVFALLGMLVLVVRLPASRVRAVAAGALLGIALLFKATFVADLAAALAIPAIAALAGGGRPGRAELRTSALVAAGAIGLVGLALVPIAFQGALPAFVDVVVHQDARYARWAQLTGPHGGEPLGFAATPSTLLQLLGITRLIAVVVAAAAVSLVLARRRHRSAAILALWLGVDVAVCMADARGFTHYVQQMEAPLALLGALGATSAWRRGGSASRVLAAASLAAVWPAMLVALFIPRAEVAVAEGHRLPPLTLEGAGGRQIPGYYGRFARLALHLESIDAYRAYFHGSQYPDDVARANLLRAHSRPGDPVFVYGWTSSWVYAFADRVPASRFIWMDSAYHLYPGAGRLLEDDLSAHPPAVLLAEEPLTPQLRELLTSRGYAPSHERIGDCWLAPWAPGRSG